MVSLVFLTVFGLAGLPLSFSAGQKLHLKRGIHDGHRHGAVSSLDARCSKAGLDMLERGGNAADATIATEFCLSVIGLHYTGIGGGGVALIRDLSGNIDFLDFRETAPAASTEDMFATNATAARSGGLSSGVPGLVRGLEEIHKKYGSLPWTELLQPAINLARDGFIIGQDLAFHISNLKDEVPFLEPSWAVDFAPNGTLVGLGDVLKRSRHADVLEEISLSGPDSFYSGRIAKTMVDAVKASGGILTMADLQGYEVLYREVRSIPYEEFVIHGSSAPFGGTVAFNILNVLKGYPGIADNTNVNITTHRLNEAMRFAFGMRTKLGDPDFVDDLDRYQDSMLSEAVAAEIRGLISDNGTLPLNLYNPEGLESLPTPGTSHVSAADSSGLVISLTSTINTEFGSYVTVPETGIVMNNEMNDFSNPSKPGPFGNRSSSSNYIKPGKRPLSSMNPVIIEHALDNTFSMAIGAAGGTRIITSVVQALWCLLDRNMTLQDALKEPRFHDQLSPNQTTYEWEYNNATVAFMEDRGHIAAWQRHGSAVQAVRQRRNGTFEAASEPRQLDSGAFVI